MPKHDHKTKDMLETLEQKSARIALHAKTGRDGDKHRKTR